METTVIQLGDSIRKLKEEAAPLFQMTTKGICFLSLIHSEIDVTLFHGENVLDDNRTISQSGKEPLNS